MADPTFPLMALSRHRLGTDGQGVTTLAAAWGCPLACRWCLNPQCARPDTPRQAVTPRELYERTRVDDLYFQATLGGVTFGGGEPLAHAAFIHAFRGIVGGAWRLSAETSLYIPEEALTTAIDCVDVFIVDIKDTEPAIYRRYTGRDNARVLQNLRTLLKAVGPERVLVRVPRIPGYNAPEDVERSRERLKSMGVAHMDLFPYVTGRS